MIEAVAAIGRGADCFEARLSRWSWGNFFG